MNKWFSLLIGLILVLVPIYVWGIDWVGFGNAALLFLKGGIMWVLMLAGLLLVILGIKDL